MVGNQTRPVSTGGPGLPAAGWVAEEGATVRARQACWLVLGYLEMGIRAWVYRLTGSEDRGLGLGQGFRG